jgi:hypothetical protein
MEFHKNRLLAAGEYANFLLRIQKKTFKSLFTNNHASSTAQQIASSRGNEKRVESKAVNVCYKLAIIHG